MLSIQKQQQKPNGFLFLFHQIATTVVSSSSNKVYLNADSLLLNSLGDTTFAEEQKSPTKKNWMQ
jgi:hypothetical protein